MNEEVNKFFEDLPGEDKQMADIFGNSTEDKPAEEAREGESDKDEEPRKNRRHRRLEQALEKERQARMEAEALLKARAEYGNKDGNSEVDARLIRLYGDTDEGREAARLTQELLNDARKGGEEDAIRRIQETRAKELSEQAQLEEFIDNELEDIEEKYNVDITSDAPAARKARRELGELVTKLSPKDQDGNITAYADFGEAWELYEAAKKNGTTSRAKEIAARSMEKSGTTAAAPQAPTPGFRGWQRDFNLN